MIPAIRDKFNSEYTLQNYEAHLNSIWRWTKGVHDFRICETPLFIDQSISTKLQEASYEIAACLQTEEFIRNSSHAIPKDLFVPDEDSHPLFLQIDFAITRNEKNEFLPQLIELQGFPSLYMFQSELDRTNRKYYNIPDGYTTYFSGLEFESYIDLMKKAMVGNHQSENVILLEIKPDKQKTRIDFYITKELIGIESVCLTEVSQKGKKLFYKKNGREIPIYRIYNRVIFDELHRKSVKSGFDFHEELDVEWAGHPNWFFRISKHSLPLIKSQYAPQCYYLNELDQYPSDLGNYVLKPLYSFAGAGVIVDLKKDSLDKIEKRENYILQRKVEYAPLIKTPDEYSRAEIRMMFIWFDKPMLVNNLLRTSKGKMMGVDFNKGKTWVGSNIVYHP
ncbi:hypothetical protein C0389_03420 [bacterium]|nr:hypothetical protein [bacterium]